jgi:hypothetical protein
MRAPRLILPTAALVALAMPVVSIAQPSGEIVLDAPFQWTTDDTATARRQDLGASVSLDHLLADERVTVFYDLTMDALGTAAGARTWLHNAGVMGTIDGETRALDLGGSLFWRANQGMWDGAGFKGVSAVTSLRLHPRPAAMAAASYAFYLRRFPDEPALNQNEHYGSLRGVLNLPSRTTVAVLLSVGRKRYEGRETIVVPPDILPGGAQGRGPGWRRTFTIPAEAVAAAGPGIRNNWTWAARVAQSLDDRTGVWLEREERRTGGDPAPSIVWTPPLFHDDGVYDDPYVTDARTWRAGAKHVFAAGQELSTALSYSERRYWGLGRSDTLTRASLDGSVPLVRRDAFGIDAVASYGFFQNDSTDVLEDYRAHVVAAGLRLSF